MKIVFVHHGSVIGGAPTSLRLLLEGLREKHPEWNLTVLCVYPSMKPFFEKVSGVTSGDFPDPGLILGKTLIGWSPWYRWKTIKGMVGELWNIRDAIRAQVAVLEKERPDIIHLNSSVCLTTGVAAERIGVPLLWHIREIMHGTKLSLCNWIARSIIERFAHTIICIGSEEGEKFRNKRKVRVVPNFVDRTHYETMEDTSSDVREQLELLPDDFVIVSLGGLSWRKGPLELLGMIKLLPAQVKLVLVGCPNREDIKPLPLNSIQKTIMYVEDLLVEWRLLPRIRYQYEARVRRELAEIPRERIRLVPVTEDVRPLLSISNVVAAVHNFPHSSRPVFEAWSMKKPVLVVAKSGASNGVTHDQNGIVAEGTCSKVLAAAVSPFLEERNLLEQLGEQGHATASELHDKDTAVEALSRCYQEIQVSDSDG